MAKLTLGDRIRFIRNEKKLSQEEFGAMLTPPANKAVVSHWESNINAPRKARLEQIAKIGDVSLEYLKGGQVDPGKLQDALHATKIGEFDNQTHEVIGESAFELAASYDLNKRIIETNSRKVFNEFETDHHRRLKELSISGKSATWKFLSLLKLFEKYNIEVDDGYLNQHSEALAELLDKISDCAKDQTARNRKAAKAALNELLDGLKNVE